MRLSYEAIQGTVVIYNLQIRYTQCTEIVGNFGRGNIQVILFEIFLVGSRIVNIWYPD